MAASARRVVVGALGASGAILATASTDEGGNYSLQVPSSTDEKIRAKAQSLVASTAAAPGSSARSR